MSAFEESNYTQIPNELLDVLLPEIKTMGELKVTLAIARQTFGWHRPKQAMSLTWLMKLTGLSRQSVSDGVQAAVERGYVTRSLEGKTAVFTLNVKDLGSQESGPLLVKEVDRSLVKDLDPKKERDERKERNLPVVPSSSSGIQRVWSRYVAVMNPRRKELDPDASRIINAALKVATAEECCTAIDACFASDWHMKRNGSSNRKGAKHNTIGKILKPRPSRGETQRSRIDWWLEQREEQVAQNGTAPDEDVNARAIRQLREQGRHAEADEMEAEQA